MWTRRGTSCRIGTALLTTLLTQSAAAQIVTDDIAAEIAKESTEEPRPDSPNDDASDDELPEPEEEVAEEDQIDDPSYSEVWSEERWREHEAKQLNGELDRLRAQMDNASTLEELVRIQMGLEWLLDRLRDQSLEPTPALKDLEQRANEAWREVEEKKDTEYNKRQSLCPRSKDHLGGWLRMCGYVGIFAASLSRVKVGKVSGPFGGTSSRQIASVAVPNIGMRFMLPQASSNLALDMGIYSAAISPTFAANTSRGDQSCNETPTEFERRLPCEGNAPVVPYAAGYVGATVGTAGVGYLTIIPFTVGTANVGNQQSIRPFIGWMVGAIELHGTLP